MTATKTETNKLALVPPDRLEVGRPIPTPAEMLAGIIERGVTKDNVQALEAVVKLYERMEDRNAEKAFASAFVELQREIPKVQATKAVPNNDGTTRYTYAPFEAIDDQARPLCLKHGFTYTFSEGPQQPGKLTKVCTLQHVQGHKRDHAYTVRIGSGPPKASESQADGAAHTYAKRGALCDALSIVVKGQDNDARNEGASVTAEQAFELERRVKETNSDAKAFLKYAGASKFSEIAAVKYAILDGFLQKRERGKHA